MVGNNPASPFVFHADPVWDGIDEGVEPILLVLEGKFGLLALGHIVLSHEWVIARISDAKALKIEGVWRTLEISIEGNRAVR